MLLAFYGVKHSFKLYLEWGNSLVVSTTGDTYLKEDDNNQNP